ncbi:MAG: hypothetical protein Q9M37_05255 [Desulfonauticus sp.]|nr:hypothetical protein [Desulfonauticus sp.]
MKKNDLYYNIIILKDDSPVKTFRLKVKIIKFIPILIIALFTYAVLGTIYFYKSSQKYHSCLKLLAQKEKDLNKLRFELSRLKNVKKFLDKYDEDYLNKLIAGSGQNLNQNKIDLNQIFAKKNLNFVKINNIQWLKDDNFFVLRFELNNLEPTKEIKGKVEISLITRDGSCYPLNIQNKNLKFSITRFKVVQIRFKLPRYIKEKDVFGIRLTVKDKQEQVVFCETYPLVNISL